MPRSFLYETDFYAWGNEQATLLRAGRLSAADIENIAEEIETIGRGEKREPTLRGNNFSVKEQRIRIASHLADNPGLKALLTAAISQGYELALIEAQRETDLGEEAFPAACPWSFEQMMDADFWPNDA